MHSSNTDTSLQGHFEDDCRMWTAGTYKDDLFHNETPGFKQKSVLKYNKLDLPGIEDS